MCRNRDWSQLSGTCSNSHYCQLHTKGGFGIVYQIPNGNQVSFRFRPSSSCGDLTRFFYLYFFFQIQVHDFEYQTQRRWFQGWLHKMAIYDNPHLGWISQRKMVPWGRFQKQRFLFQIVKISCLNLFCLRVANWYSVFVETDKTIHSKLNYICYLYKLLASSLSNFLVSKLKFWTCSRSLFNAELCTQMKSGSCTLLSLSIRLTIGNLPDFMNTCVWKIFDFLL